MLLHDCYEIFLCCQHKVVYVRLNLENCYFEVDFLRIPDEYLLYWALIPDEGAGSKKLHILVAKYISPVQ